MLITKQLSFTIDFHCQFSSQWELKLFGYHIIILQNIVFCVPRKNEIHTGVERHDSE